jgi:hypothetical protein
MKHRIGMSIVCLHIAAAFYAIAGVTAVLVAIFAPEEAREMAVIGRIAMGVVAFLSFTFATVAEVVAWGLRRRMFWAWILGLIVFGTYVLSPLLVLGVLGLWGLFDPGSRREFGIGGSSRQTVPPNRIEPEL